MMRIGLLVILVCGLFCFQSTGQILYTDTERVLYLVDTVQIDDPVVIRFREDTYTQQVLVSKHNLDCKDEQRYTEFLYNEKGYLFITADLFSILMSHLMYTSPALKKSPFYVKLDAEIENSAKDDVWVFVDKAVYDGREYNGWKYYDIYPRKFLLFLVKGDALRRCQAPYDDIIIRDMDNMYFKVLVPVKR